MAGSMNRREFLQVSGLALAAAANVQCVASPGGKGPNVLFLMTDDGDEAAKTFPTDPPA